VEQQRPSLINLDGCEPFIGTHLRNEEHMSVKLERVAMILVVLLLSACVSPYMRIKTDKSSFKDAPTLMSAAVFDNSRTTSDEEKSGNLSGTLQLISNASLDEVGATMLSDAEKLLKSHGFVIEFDKKRARNVDLVSGKAVDALNKVGQVLGGKWVSPKGAQMTSVTDQTWLLDSYSARLVRKLKGAGENEHFLFISARGLRDSEWLVMARPQVVLYYLVLNNQGRAVLEARGIGHGDSSFLFEDQTPENLGVALKRAQENMLLQPVEAL
jgi:hypothetical protein